MYSVLLHSISFRFTLSRPPRIFQVQGLPLSFLRPALRRSRRRQLFLRKRRRGKKGEEKKKRKERRKEERKEGMIRRCDARNARSKGK